MAKRIVSLAVVHCSATKPELSETLTVDQVRKWHTDPKSKGGRGWSDIGYHFFIDMDGRIHLGRPLRRSGAHVRGHNDNSIGICYAGGLDAAGRSKDTRTEAQKKSLRILLKYLQRLDSHPDIEIQTPLRIVGHRDLSPDLDGDGEIEPEEWLKDCPCFNAELEYKNL